MRWACCPPSGLALWPMTAGRHPCASLQSEHFPLVILKSNFLLIFPLFLRKEDAISSLQHREYAIWTNGPAFGSTVESESNLQKLATALKVISFLFWSQKAMWPCNLINLMEIPIAHEAPFYSISLVTCSVRFPYAQLLHQHLEVTGLWTVLDLTHGCENRQLNTDLLETQISWKCFMQ